MAWRRRSRGSSYNRSYSYKAPQIAFNSVDYYRLKRDKSKGEAYTITILCDAGHKMHKITFYDRGDIKLHDHNLKNERAAATLAGDEYKMPRCVNYLNQWKENLLSYEIRLNHQSRFRDGVMTLHRETKQVSDADGLDLDQTTRLISILHEVHSKIYEKIMATSAGKKLNRYTSSYGNSEYVEKAKLDLSKLTITLKRKQHEPKKSSYRRVEVDMDKLMATAQEAANQIRWNKKPPARVESE